MFWYHLLLYAAFGTPLVVYDRVLEYVTWRYDRHATEARDG